MTRQAITVVVALSCTVLVLIISASVFIPSTVVVQLVIVALLPTPTLAKLIAVGMLATDLITQLVVRITVALTVLLIRTALVVAHVAVADLALAILVPMTIARDQPQVQQ